MYKYLLLSASLLMSFGLYGQNWKENYIQLKACKNGQYIAQGEAGFGLLSAKGDSLIPLQLDSLLEKKSAYLSLSRWGGIEEVDDKKGQLVALGRNELFPGADHPAWDKKAIPVLKSYPFLLDKKQPRYLFEKEQFDLLQLFPSNTAYALKGDQVFILDLLKEKKKRLKQYKPLVWAKKKPFLPLGYEQDSLVCYSIYSGKKCWAVKGQLSDLSPLGKNKTLISLKDGRHYSADPYKEEFLPISKPEEAEWMFIISDFIYLMNKDKSFTINNLEGKELANFPVSALLESKPWVLNKDHDRRPYAFIQEAGKAYLIDPIREQKIALPNLADASNISVFDESFEQVIFQIGAEYLVLSFSAEQPAKCQLISSGRSYNAPKLINQAGFGKNYLYVQSLANKKCLLDLHAGCLLEADEIQLLSLNNRYWLVQNDGSSRIYDASKKVFLPIKQQFEAAYCLEQNGKIQFLISQAIDKEQVRLDLIQSSGQLIKSRNFAATEITHIYQSKKGTYRSKDNLILLSNGTLIGVDAFPLLKINQQARYFYAYQQGDQFAALFFNPFEDQKHLLLDFNKKELLLPASFQISSKQAPNRPYLLMEKDDQERLLVNLSNTQSLTLSKKEKEEYAVVSKTLNQSFDWSDNWPSPEKLDYIEHQYIEDGYIVRDLYQLPSLKFYKKFKQKLLPHQIGTNVYSHFNYQKEKFVGQAFYHHQQFSDADQYDFELNFRYQLGKIK